MLKVRTKNNHFEKDKTKTRVPQGLFSAISIYQTTILPHIDYCITVCDYAPGIYLN